MATATRSHSREATAAAEAATVPAGRFYTRWDGHDPSALALALRRLRAHHGEGAPALLLAGDSTLDNKAWLFPRSARALTADAKEGGDVFSGPALHGYEEVRCACDAPARHRSAHAHANVQGTPPLPGARWRRC